MAPKSGTSPSVPGDVEPERLAGPVVTSPWPCARASSRPWEGL